MKKINYLLMCAAMVAVTTFVGCNKIDDEVAAIPSYTPQEAEAQLNSLVSEMQSDVEELTSSEAVDNLSELFTLVSNDADIFTSKFEENPNKQELIKSKVRLLKRSFVPKKTLSRTTEGEFDFEAHKGIYNYNSSTGSFDFIESSNVIELNFPTTGSVNNNAQFVISTYEEILISESDDWGTWEYYSPTLIEAGLSVDNEEVASLSLDVNYSNSGLPVTASITLEVSPFTFNIQFNDSQSLSTSASAFIKLNTTTIVSVALNVKFANTTKDAFESADGHVQYRSLKMQGAVNIQGTNGSGEVDINDFFDLALYSHDKKIGDIFFKSEIVTDEWGSYETHVAYVKYADGTMIKLDVLLEPVMTELENLFTEFAI